MPMVPSELGESGQAMDRHEAERSRPSPLLGVELPLMCRAGRWNNVLVRSDLHLGNAARSVSHSNSHSVPAVVDHAGMPIIGRPWIKPSLDGGLLCKT